jgi:hypothetical protein
LRWVVQLALQLSLVQLPSHETLVSSQVLVQVVTVVVVVVVLELLLPALPPLLPAAAVLLQLVAH